MRTRKIHIPLFPMIPLVPLALMGGSLAIAIRALVRVRRLENAIAPTGMP
jgi:hypothetical protein